MARLVRAKTKVTAAPDDLQAQVQKVVSQTLKVTTWKELGDYQIGFVMADVQTKGLKWAQLLIRSLNQIDPKIKWFMDAGTYRNEAKRVGLLSIYSDYEPDEVEEDAGFNIVLNCVSNLVTIEVL